MCVLTVTGSCFGRLRSVSESRPLVGSNLVRLALSALILTSKLRDRKPPLELWLERYGQFGGLPDRRRQPRRTHDRDLRRPVPAAKPRYRRWGKPSLTNPLHTQSGWVPRWHRRMRSACASANSGGSSLNCGLDASRRSKASRPTSSPISPITLSGEGRDPGYWGHQPSSGDGRRVARRGGSAGASTLLPGVRRVRGHRQKRLR